MRKLDFKYIFWKVIIHLLVLAMTLVFGVLLNTVLESNGFSPETVAKWVSGVTLLLFLLFQYWLLLRSDLSLIDRTAYILGESMAFGILTVLAGAVTVIISENGAVPKPFGGFSVAPLFGCYLFGRVDLGVLALIVGYPAIVFLTYGIKKRKDPSLLGAKKQLQSKEAQQDEPEEPREEEEQEEERS